MSPIHSLKFTTCQAPNQDFIIAGISAYVGVKLAMTTEFVDHPDWRERQRQFDSGHVDVAWICGLPYIWRADRLDSTIELLAAPVMLGARYADQPVYFSDVIVRRERPYQQFSDLRGSRWAYNEPNSHSGYNITCYTLAKLGESQGFFGSALEAGSHQAAIQLVLANQVDAAAIDSTVLELEQDVDPRIAAELRIIASLGPSPIPPLVISKEVPPALRAEIREVLTEMHQDPEGQRILNEGKVKRLHPVKNADYDLIRQMTRLAQDVKL